MQYMAYKTFRRSAKETNTTRQVTSEVCSVAWLGTADFGADGLAVGAGVAAASV